MPDSLMPEPRRSRPNLEQRIAQHQAQLARLKQQKSQQSRKLATREKIIVGGAMIAAARADPEIRKAVSAIVRHYVTKDLDREVVAGWLSDT